jgi:hypothetical protein
MAGAQPVGAESRLQRMTTPQRHGARDFKGIAMPRAPSRPLHRLMLILAGALMLTWPALVNGGVFYSTDSIAYIREPDRAIVKLLGPGHATPWSAKSLGVGYHDGAAPAAANLKSPPMAGRSIYYGLLANLGARAGGFWLTVAVQALAAARAPRLASSP